MKCTIGQLRKIMSEELDRLDEVQELWWVKNEWPEAINDLVALVGIRHNAYGSAAILEYIKQNFDFDTEEKETGRGEFDVHLIAMDRATGQQYVYDDLNSRWGTHYPETDAEAIPLTMYSAQVPRGVDVPENLDQGNTVIKEAMAQSVKAMAAAHLEAAYKKLRTFNGIIERSAADAGHPIGKHGGPLEHRLRLLSKRTMKNLEQLRTLIYGD